MMQPPEVSKGLLAARGLAFVLTFLVGLFSFILSFAALRDLAVRAHIPSDLAWMWPAVIDGTILLATLGVVALAPYPHRGDDRAYFWKLLIGSAVVSVGFNMGHAFLPVDAPLPTVLTGLIAAIAPISLLLTTHGLVQLARKGTVPVDIQDVTVERVGLRGVEGLDDSVQAERLDTTERDVPTAATSRDSKPIELHEYSRWHTPAVAVIERASIQAHDEIVVAKALHLSYDRAWPQRQVGDQLKMSHNTVGKIVKTCAQLMREGQVIVAEAS